MENMDIFVKTRSVPSTAQKKIKGGRLSGFTDINPMWRLEKLTELFGPSGFGWYYTIDRTWTEAGDNDTIAAFVEISLYIKQDDEWSKPIKGLGGNMLVAKERGGLYTSDECYKMALTDAISVACKSLGMGADIYYGRSDSKYDKVDSAPEAAPSHEATAPDIVEYVCYDCGGGFNFKALDKNGKHYSALDLIESRKSKSRDGHARCKDCLNKHLAGE